MTAHSVCRLIVDSPAEGAWNMAVDEALLDNVAESNVPTLRFYQWRHPTLSLGYFQRLADRQEHQPSLQADVVRRLSGGGAILHDREITYSLVLPGAHPLARDTQALYRTIHEAIVRLTKRLLDPEPDASQLELCTTPAARGSAKEPFLCFERRAPGDVLWRSNQSSRQANWPKVVGSAQRRRRGAVLQHGSLLLGRSAFAPSLAGLRDLSGQSLEPEELLAMLPEAIAGELGFHLQPYCSRELQSPTKALVQCRYSSRAWTERR